MNHYQVLGIHRDASAHAIKMAYRHCAKLYHPDLNPDNAVEANEKLQMINEAYRTLSKPELRRAYDADLLQVVQKATTVAKARPTPQYEANRFEAKDALLGLIFCFLFMLVDPAASLLKFGNIIILWPFLFGSIVIAQLGQKISTLYFRFGLKDAEYVVLSLSLLVAAGILSLMAEFLAIPLREPLFVFPILPALLASLAPSIIGAGIGRAFNRTLGVFAGLVGGAVIGLILAVPAAAACVVAQIAHEGPDVLGSGSTIELFLKPVRSVLMASVLASAIGSFRVRRVFVFAILEWSEDLVERIWR